METLANYVLQIIAGGLLLGICMCICPDNKKLGWFFSLFFLFILLSPLQNGSWKLRFSFPEEIRRRSEEITTTAQADAADQIREGIIRRSCAYILDEARSLGIQVCVEAMALEEDGFLPVRVELRGELQNEEKQKLSQMISQDLGIGEEGIIWKE